jgi:predicted N-acetyltransferase YhbS
MDKQPSWEITLYSKEDLPSILASNQEEYGNSDLANSSYFEWIVEKNPNGPPIFLVARDIDTRRVLGWIIFVPFQILYKGEMKKVLLGFNLMVRKEYRRQGISTEMFQFGMADGKKKGYPLIAGLTNPKSTAVAQKIGVILPNIPMVIRIMDIPSLMSRYSKNYILQRVIGIGLMIAGPIIFRETPPKHGKNTLEIKEESIIGIEFDSFWENVKHKYDLILVRDRAFIQWRFPDMPLRSYRILTARKKDEILGYIILRVATVRGILCGLVSDLMVVPGKDGDTAGLLLMNAATRFFREAHVQLCGGLMMPHTQEYRIMRKAGYVRSPNKFSPERFSLSIQSLLNEIPLNEIQRPESWFISNADHDAA